jgi:hypothetical protein
MKIQVLESNSKKPLISTKIQIQIKGKNSGYLTLSTDNSGFLQLDDKYIGDQISTSYHGQGPWINASNNAILTYNSKETQSAKSANGSKQTTSQTSK